MAGETRDFSTLAKWMVPHRRKVHLAIALLTLLMLPGVLTAIEPIDVESYDLDSPEIEALDVIKNEFGASEEVVGFMVILRDRQYVEDEHADVPSVSEGIPDYANLHPNTEIASFTGKDSGVNSPTGGILNLSVIQEIDRKANIARNHSLGQHLTPMVNDVTGWQSDGIMTVTDIFRHFMANDSILTREGVSPFGSIVPPRTQWTDCGIIECLQFDDPAITQAHIDLAAHRMANSSEGNFLRWLSLDRAFLPDPTSDVTGPIGGKMSFDGNFSEAIWGKGRWSASATWLLVQLDKPAMKENGWTFSWKDAHPESKIDWPVVGGYTFHDGEFIAHPPNYDDEKCAALAAESAPCATEWGIQHLEGSIRSSDHQTISLMIGVGVNVEITREVQSSMNLLFLMGLAIIILLWFSLRRVSDVLIVCTALGGALLWMQGLIGHASLLGDWFGFDIISRSQFSNLLPILVLALGIDDSLHALHRYKEERKKGATPSAAAEVTVAKVGRAIMLTSLTTIAAFASNLFSDIAALRSFGIEAALGVFAAFVLTGIWAPLLRLSIDLWLEKRGKLKPEKEGQIHLVPSSWLAFITTGVAKNKSKWVIAVIAILVTIPATIGMVGLEGDFKVEDFLDDSSDMAVGVNIINERFSDEGEPAVVLIEGDILNPQVFAAIDETRWNMDRSDGGISDKITRKPNGQAEIHGVDELVFLLTTSMIENSTPFEQVGWNTTSADHGVGCTDNGAPLFMPNLQDRGCLAFFYGFMSLYGIPETATIPHMPPSIIALYISPDEPLSPTSPHLTVGGDAPVYKRTLLRFGITQPDDFPSMQPFLDTLEDDFLPFINFTSDDYRERGDVDSTINNDDNPVSWVMWTGKPVTRFVAADSMQTQMQSSLFLGAIFVILTLWWGFRSLSQSLITTGPILLVVVWLYGLIAASGGNLNLVTVAIAAISLGVGVDYCIHVTERYREERSNGANRNSALAAVGGASGLALVGSAASDVSGFMIISISPMGLFASFGLFSSAMIILSLIASLVLTCAAIGFMPDKKAKQEAEKQAFMVTHTVDISEAVIPTFDYESIAKVGGAWEGEEAAYPWGQQSSSVPMMPNEELTILTAESTYPTSNTPTPPVQIPSPKQTPAPPQAPHVPPSVISDLDDLLDF